MATAKEPGIGQGKGGGRPKRGEVVRMRLDLTPKAAGLLQSHAEAECVPIWQVVERLVLAGLGEEPTVPPLPPMALEITQEAAVFLALHADKQEAPGVLQTAWRRTLLLAAHDLKMRQALSSAK